MRDIEYGMVRLHSHKIYWQSHHTESEDRFNRDAARPRKTLSKCTHSIEHLCATVAFWVLGGFSRMRYDRRYFVVLFSLHVLGVSMMMLLLYASSVGGGGGRFSGLEMFRRRKATERQFY